MFLSKLKSSISEMKLIYDAERACYLLQLVEKRMVFMSGDAHGIAYLLDPQYFGSGMSMEKRLAVEELILVHPSSSESDNKPTVEEEKQSVLEEAPSSSGCQKVTAFHPFNNWLNKC